MQRYVKVRGVAGKLVLDPRAPDANPRRFVGMRRKPVVDDAPVKWTVLADLYEPSEAIVRKADVEGALASGDLELVGEALAANVAAAEIAFTAVPKAPKNALRAKDGE